MSELTYDLRELIHRIEMGVERHSLGETGHYARWLTGDGNSSREAALNPYGCADAANILYTIGRFPRDPDERRRWVETLQGLQDRKTGLFREGTHHPLHTSAHCIAALELFDAGPVHPLSDLAHLRDPGAMESFLDGLDWKGDPWNESHKGAGLFAALVLTDEVSREWQDRYLAWVDAETDPHTGLLRKGCVPPRPRDPSAWFGHLAGTFHYLFNLEYARRPLRHPDALVDTCLAIYERGSFPIGTKVWFAEIDWVYCLTRSLRQSGHRFREARAALLAFADEYLRFLNPLDLEADEGGRDLHRLFGAVCALAELQGALPGVLRTERPLRLVLDRRPFI
jgi:hypothetical protein